MKGAASNIAIAITETAMAPMRTEKARAAAIGEDSSRSRSERV